jgi:hypothetical protein
MDHEDLRNGLLISRYGIRHTAACTLIVLEVPCGAESGEGRRGIGALSPYLESDKTLLRSAAPVSALVAVFVSACNSVPAAQRVPFRGLGIRGRFADARGTGNGDVPVYKQPDQLTVQRANAAGRQTEAKHGAVAPPSA